MTKEACPECKAFFSHAPTCSLLSGEEAREMLRRYVEKDMRVERYINEKISRANSIAQRCRETMQLWKGKFLEVKHENNKLRRKLQGIPPKEEPKPEFKQWEVEVISYTFNETRKLHRKTKWHHRHDGYYHTPRQAMDAVYNLRRSINATYDYNVIGKAFHHRERYRIVKRERPEEI